MPRPASRIARPRASGTKRIAAAASTLETPLRAGDYAFAPKGSTMFAYCPDGAIVQVHGIGPFQIHWRHGLKTLDNAASAFAFRKGQVVDTPRGRGKIRQGYGSGDIMQYEIALENGSVVMVDQADLHRA